MLLYNDFCLHKFINILFLVHTVGKDILFPNSLNERNSGGEVTFTFDRGSDILNLLTQWDVRLPF